jgi:hypothetical protein
VTALACCGEFLIAAEGPYLRFYYAQDSRYIASKRVFKAQAVHGITAFLEEHNHATRLLVWGGRLVRAVEITLAFSENEESPLNIYLSEVTIAPDWILDLAPRPNNLEEATDHTKGAFVAVTSHNALAELVVEQQSARNDTSKYDHKHIEYTNAKMPVVFSPFLSRN